MKDQSPPKKLFRSRSDRYIGGVAAGIAARFDVDPVFVRIAFLASLAFGGLGLLAYVAMLVAVPIEGDASEPLPPLEPKRRNLMIGLAVLIGFVCLVTADSGNTAAWLFGFWPGTVFGVLFWVAAAALAIWLFASGFFKRDQGDEGAVQRPGPVAESRPAEPDPSEASTEVVTYADSPTQLSRTEIMETRQMPPLSGAGAGAAAARGADEDGSESPAPAVRDDGPSTIGRIMTWFAIGITGLIVFCLLFGFSTVVTATLGGVPMAALVIVLGAGMIFAGLRGRPQLSGWLLAAAVAVTLPMAAVSIADLRIEGPYGDIKKTPMSVIDIPSDGYEMAAGNMTIDLRKLDFEAPDGNGKNRGGSGTGQADPLEIPVRSGMGLTSIVVPDDVCVVGEVEGKAGVANFRGRQSNGLDLTQGAEVTANPLDPRIVEIDGEFKLGAFEVVDDTQWRRNGSGGSFEDNDLEPSDRASAAARARASAACAAPVRPTDGAEENSGARS